MITLFDNNTYFCQQIEFLEQVLHLMDSHVEAIDKWESQDPEAAGMFQDRQDCAIGLGFMACQQYITAVFNFWKLTPSVALALGRKVAGVPVASAINTAANWWKHHAEWTCDPHAEAKSTKTKREIQRFGLDPDGASVQHDILAKISSDKTLIIMIDDLSKWTQCVAQKSYATDA